MINFTMDQIKILIGHIEMEKFDLHLQLERAKEEIVRLTNENINLREAVGKDLETK